MSADLSSVALVSSALALPLVVASALLSSISVSVVCFSVLSVPFEVLVTLVVPLFKLTLLSLFVLLASFSFVTDSLSVSVLLLSALVTVSPVAALTF